MKRLYFSGHSHHFCRTKNKDGVTEFTLASFNWRNTNNPSFMMAIITPSEISTSKCDLPRETTVFSIYAIGTIFSIIFSIVRINFAAMVKGVRKKSTKEIE
jgi:ethanolamine phosphate phosphodiesterase